jgi:hypothetical protein
MLMTEYQHVHATKNYMYGTNLNPFATKTWKCIAIPATPKTNM